MKHVLTQIKNAITSCLKELDPEVDIFYEEITGTGEEHGLNIGETYYFVELIPAVCKTVDAYFTDIGILVDIAYHDKNESNTAYLMKGAEIDVLFRPIFSFGDRKITVHDASFKVVDHVLHFSFAVNFRYAGNNPDEYERMGELAVAVRRGEVEC